jgi:hypothetical protein
MICANRLIWTECRYMSLRATSVDYGSDLDRPEKHPPRRMDT